MSHETLPRRAQIVAIVSRVFALPRTVVESGVGPDRVENWTSEKHVELVLALEEHFGCMFDAEEVPELTSIEQMETIIARHA
jgi:acyl carrier protein